MEFIKKLAKNFAELVRAYALLVTLAPCFIIYAFAHYSEKFSILNFIILVLALCCVHLGANLFDDYIDVKRQYKKTNSLKDVNFERFAKKAELILNETFSFREIEIVIAVLFLIAVLCGIYFVFVSSPFVLLYALFGGLLAIFYPIAPKYGLGEAVLGLIYGPLMINGGYLALCNSFNFGLFVASLSVFFSTIVLAYTDSLMDWEFDIKENKKTFCIILGSKERAVKWLRYIINSAYGVIVFGVLFGILNPKTLYVFLTLPIATKLHESMIDYINIKDVEFVPKWYHGFFENWKKIQEMKIDFFMYRFYLGRNFAFFFALFLAIGTVL